MTRCRATAVSRIEVLVIATVVGLAIAAVGFFWVRSSERTRAEMCSRILESYGKAFAAYAADHGGVLPYENVGAESQGHVAWREAVAGYMNADADLCPSVDTGVPNYEEGYRMNSKLGRRRADPPQPYRRLSTLEQPDTTVLLFDGRYGGTKRSLKGRIDDVDYRHLGAANVLFADWHVASFEKAELEEASGWLPAKMIWDPDAAAGRN